MMAYVCLLRLRLKANPTLSSWSVFQAKWDLLAMIFAEREEHLRLAKHSVLDYHWGEA